jgi:hypothetical protein
MGRDGNAQSKHRATDLAEGREPGEDSPTKVRRAEAMSKLYGRTGFALLALGVFCSLETSQLAAQESLQKRESINLQEVLSWLPEDTETIAVARGPFVLPSTTTPIKEDEKENRVVKDRELAELFQSLPLSLFGFKDGLLLPRLKGKRILLGIEGSRHFRPPSGLGQMPYEGCAIALLADNLDDDIASFAKSNRKAVLRVEKTANQEVAVFQEKLENDIWTIFVAFPNKRMIAVATNRDYLEEVLARLGGKKGNRALPNDLPEWKYVNTDLQFWGLRHYDRSQANMDPSSPFGGKKSANDPDEQSIGLTLIFDHSIGKSAKITYLSDNKSIGGRPDETLLSMGKGSEAAALNIKYRELEPGVVEGSYTLNNLGQVQFFFFVFLGMLGHAVYI